MAITLNLNFGAPDDWRIESMVYIPVSPDAISQHNKTGWTTYDLEKQAFDTIPSEFEEIRRDVGKSLELLSALGDVTLNAYGPDEGEYLIGIPRPKAEKKPNPKI